MKVVLMRKTRGHIILVRRLSPSAKNKEMTEKGYFVEGEARAPGAETVPEPDSDEGIVYEEFFVAGLCMPPHPTLADILLKF
jgi:hypothetical protein